MKLFRKLKLHLGCINCAYYSNGFCDYFDKEIGFVFNDCLNDVDYCTDWCRKNKG